MRCSTLFAVTSLAGVFAASTAFAVPVTTAFTARIEDGSGPVDGSVDLNFKIFDAETGGTMVWEETHTGVPADRGLVYVDLGSVAPTTNGLDETVFTGGDMWLEVSVHGNTQSPRLPIGSVPYAVHAATADTLGTLAPGDVAMSTHDHAGTYADASHSHSEYASATHTHSATDITSGTLSTSRYDAYDDLSVSGRLDNNAGTDLLTRSQGDARWGPMTCSVREGSSKTLTASDGVQTATASCLSGEIAVGGGVRVSAWSLAKNCFVIFTRPNVTSGTPTGWTVGYSGTGGDCIGQVVRATAVCCSP